MSVYLDKLREKTRWDKIPDTTEGHRLLCSNNLCSLSCANIRDGRLAVTSIHGSDRHSYQFTKNDMAFAAILFLDSLSEKELEVFCNMFGKISDEYVLKSNKI